MNDQIAYQNAYLEVTLEQLHGLINSTLQIKTQLKIVNDAFENSKKHIEQLQNEINRLQDENSVIASLRMELESKENKINQLTLKATHVDTYSTQIIDMKEMIKNKDLEISKLQKKLKLNKINNDKSDEF